MSVGHPLLDEWARNRCACHSGSAPALDKVHQRMFDLLVNVLREGVLHGQIHGATSNRRRQTWGSRKVVWAVVPSSIQLSRPCQSSHLAGTVFQYDNRPGV